MRKINLTDTAAPSVLALGARDSRRGQRGEIPSPSRTGTPSWAGTCDTARCYGSTVTSDTPWANG